jgi:hypothetical protein
MKLVTPAQAGVQIGGPLDSGLRRNDEAACFTKCSAFHVNPPAD